MDIWLPIARRIATEYGKTKQRFIVALAETLPHRLAVLERDLPDFRTHQDGVRVDWFRSEDRLYRRVYHSGTPVSSEELATAPSHRLFYSWSSPATLEWQDHPCARNVTFEQDGPLKAPLPYVDGDVRFALGNQTAVAELDDDGAKIEALSTIAKCRISSAELVKEASAPTMAIVLDRRKCRMVISAEGLATPTPFSVHFGLGQEAKARGFARAATGTSMILEGELWGTPSPGAEAAARSTLISATVALVGRLGNQAIKRVPLDEIDLLRLARGALVRRDGYEVEGVLNVFADCLRASEDAKLRFIANMLNLRRGVLGPADEIRDSDLDNLRSGPVDR